MPIRMFLIAVTALAACSPAQDEQEEGSGTSSSTTTITADNGGTVTTKSGSGGGAANSSTSITTRGGLAVSEATDLYEFEYSWPAEAGAVRGLADVLQARRDKAKRSLIADAREGRDAAKESGFPFRPHSAAWEWKLVAQTPRFVSLGADVSSYGGGAHGNYGREALLWDKPAGRAVAPVSLFASPAALDRAIAPRFCTELDRQREERRGMAVNKTSPFGECPSVEELEVILGSSDGRAFDRITLYAAPYIAGAYAEGDYEIVLPVDEAILRAVKPQLRSSFAAAN